MVALGMEKSEVTAMVKKKQHMVASSVPLCPFLSFQFPHTYTI